MADYCMQCSARKLGIPESEYPGDLAALSGQPGETQPMPALCESCGFITVDRNGRCQGGSGCSEGHSP